MLNCYQINFSYLSVIYKLRNITSLLLRLNKCHGDCFDSYQHLQILFVVQGDL